ncbi:helix-turn-helix domain-containing protein [Mammaliicoccus fleurettii]|uniref:helix-turn-helix domain-containing protein n=1 Tax=Mammaliicoccus fleurettii TaxID=150056 RepID=UPI001AACA0CA|nr:helix-turn-helix transcriptional regulator [Mammaliicoccus fleurettii]MBO3062011.1 helix-turn-helix domain-containing protein [Mammaliicoccus fleurettii]
MNKENFGLGGILKTLRTGAKLTTRDLAKRTGYSHSYISSVENGSKLSPSEDFVQKYLLGVSDRSIFETNHYLDLINKLADGLYYFNLLPTSGASRLDVINKEAKKISSDFTNIHLFSGKNKDVLFEEPINDIHFHLNEIGNVKYFRGIELGTDEMIEIDNMINNYLTTIYKTQISQTSFLKVEGLISDESLNKYAKIYQKNLEKLGQDIKINSDLKEALDFANEFHNEGD